MADINSLVLSGRLTRDSELSYTESGMAVLRFSLANNRRMKKTMNGLIIHNILIVLFFQNEPKVLMNI